MTTVCPASLGIPCLTLSDGLLANSEAVRELLALEGASVVSAAVVMRFTARAWIVYKDGNGDFARLGTGDLQTWQRKIPVGLAFFQTLLHQSVSWAERIWGAPEQYSADLGRCDNASQLVFNGMQQLALTVEYK